VSCGISDNDLNNVGLFISKFARRLESQNLTDCSVDAQSSGFATVYEDSGFTGRSVKVFLFFSDNR
jgi:hypothetical protein